MANGLGNLVSRVAKLCETTGFTRSKESDIHILDTENYDTAFEEFRLNDAIALVWERIGELDKFVEEEKPWELIKKEDHKIKSVLDHLTDGILEIAELLKPFLPETAEKIKKQFGAGKINSVSPLFPRI